MRELHAVQSCAMRLGGLVTMLVRWPCVHFLFANAATLPPLLVVLDLDETLVHASLCARRGPPPAIGDADTGSLRGGSQGATAASDLPSWLPSRLVQPAADFEAQGRNLILGLGEDVPLSVSVRPGAEGFVQSLLQEPSVDVAVYTAGTEPYARQTLRRLGLEGRIEAVLFRDECVPFGLPVTKDLGKLGRDLARVVLVDNAARSFWLQPQNGILVSDWKGGDPTDAELDRVLEELTGLLKVEDVRTVLPDRGGLQAAWPLLAGSASLLLLPLFLALDAGGGGVGGT